MNFFMNRGISDIDGDPLHDADTGILPLQNNG